VLFVLYTLTLNYTHINWVDIQMWIWIWLTLFVFVSENIWISIRIEQKINIQNLFVSISFPPLCREYGRVRCWSVENSKVGCHGVEKWRKINAKIGRHKACIVGPVSWRAQSFTPMLCYVFICWLLSMKPLFV